jgi:hypothetical protein
MCCEVVIGTLRLEQIQRGRRMYIVHCVTVIVGVGTAIYIQYIYMCVCVCTYTHTFSLVILTNNQQQVKIWCNRRTNCGNNIRKGLPSCTPWRNQFTTNHIVHMISLYSFNQEGQRYNVMFRHSACSVRRAVCLNLQHREGKNCWGSVKWEG